LGPNGSKRDWRVASERQQLLDRDVSELDSLASRLHAAAEAERSALARELHNELGTLLTASKMDLAWVRGRLGEEHAASHEKLARVVHHLERGIVATRRIVEGLRPSTLSDFGLATAARELTEQVAERAGWQLELDLPDADPRLAEDIEIALFRVLQESLTNAAKYAQASVLRVSLVCGMRQCRLEIEDDGRGFFLAEVGCDAQGLTGMRQRTEAHGGKLQIRSAPGEGTRIRAVLPLSSGRAVQPLRARDPLGIAPPTHEAPGIAGA
jgi:signal transduction histidine kinase